MQGINKLLSVMLSEMEPLMSYGFYTHTNDITEITDILISILDCTLDHLSLPSRGILLENLFLKLSGVCHIYFIYIAVDADNTGNNSATKDKYSAGKLTEKNREIFKIKTK